MANATTTRWVRPVVALAAAVGLAACLPSLGRPVLRQAAVAPQVWDDSDPAVLVAGGRTYLFGSTNNVLLPVREITSYAGTVAASRQAWADHPTSAMRDRPAWAAPDSQLWAPSVVRIGASYWLYFAARRAGASDPLNDQCIGRARALAPMGSYVPESDPLYCGLPAEAGSNPWGRGALDPEVVVGQDGSLTMLVALSRTRANIGAVALDERGRPVGGVNAAPATLVSQRFPWHDGVDDATLRATFLENPSMVFEPRTGTYLLFYSAGDWWSSRYVTGFGRCRTPAGPCVLEERGPFLVGGSGRSGPGGLTAYVGADGALRAAYASWTAGRENIPDPTGANSRQVSFARIAVTPTTDPAAQRVVLGAP